MQNELLNNSVITLETSNVYFIILTILIFLDIYIYTPVSLLFVNLVTMLRKLGTYFKSKEEALYQYLFRCLDHVSRFAIDGIGQNFGLVTQ